MTVASAMPDAIRVESTQHKVCLLVHHQNSENNSGHYTQRKKLVASRSYASSPELSVCFSRGRSRRDCGREWIAKLKNESDLSNNGITCRLLTTGREGKNSD